MSLVPTDEQAKRLYLVACGFEPDVFPLVFDDFDAVGDFVTSDLFLAIDNITIWEHQRFILHLIRGAVAADNLEDASRLLKKWGGWKAFRAYDTPEDCAWAVREYWKDMCNGTDQTPQTKETVVSKNRHKLEPIPLTREGPVVELPVEYHHFRLFNQHGHIINNGGVTIATCPLPQEAPASHRYAVAICSPDDQFSRPEGRRIALRRLKLQCPPDEWPMHTCPVDPPMDGRNIDRSWLRDLAEGHFCRVCWRKLSQGRCREDFLQNYFLK